MNFANDPFGRAQLPTGFTREHRVRLLREIADALIAGRRASRAAELFVGGALDAWLTEGGGLGSLERDYLRTTPPRGCRLTAAEVLRRDAEAHRDEREERD
ncbi:MAG: hypothetical protein ROZ64_04415 [Burkholderiaceae bacterium]|jgi:hypothetical protein|nr:hypothetical protein [Burkholderiaceae bacterium]